MEGISELHKKKVDSLKRQIADFYSRGVRFKIFHGSTNSTRVQRFDLDQTLDTSNLDQVLAVDENYAIVEPNVPMDKLVDATLEYGLIPPVVMEFPGITVGGGVQGGLQRVVLSKKVSFMSLV